MTSTEHGETLPAQRPWQRWFGLGVLIASIVLLVGLSIFCLDMMSAARAYVGGESLWTKGQKEAVQQLVRYAETRASEDWEAYRAAIAVPLGDRVAREELEKPQPNMDAVRRGFLDGHNHPDDIAGMVRLYRWFRGVPFLDRAIRTWERGDLLIAELVAAAEELHRGVLGGVDSATLAPTLERIRTLDIALRPLEVEFSATLGEATRMTRTLLTGGLLVTGVLLIGAGTYAVRLLARRRERYEAALRSSEERFRRALEGARDGIWEWNLHTGAMYFSPRCETLLGLAPGALPRVHRQMPPWFHPDDLERVRAATHGHLLRSEPYDVEFRLRVGDRWHWVRSRGQAVVDSESSEVRMAGSLSDVDERRTAEEALRESEIRYRTLWETTSDAVLIVNERNGIEFANHAVRALLGYEPGELIGKPMAVVQPESLHQAHRDGVTRYLESGRRSLDWRGVEVRALRRDGSEVPVEVSFGEMRLEGQRYFVGFLRDISRHKRAEAELRETNERLEQRVAERTAELTAANSRLRELDRLKSQFLATMSHELRTPLNAILGFSALLKDGPDPVRGPGQRQQLEMIESAGEHLLSVISDVLDVSAIESGRMTIERAPFDLAATIDSVIGQLRPLADRKGLRIEVEVPRADAHLTGDRRRTAQVLLNLVGNAIKFTREGTIAVRARRLGMVFAVEVSDTGIGIAAEHMPQLFEAFRQVDGSASRAHEGSGLGLHLTRQLLSLMGGAISVDSEPGRGSTFRFTLPVGAAAASARNLSAARSA